MSFRSDIRPKATAYGTFVCGLISDLNDSTLNVHILIPGMHFTKQFREDFPFVYV